MAHVGADGRAEQSRADREGGPAGCSQALSRSSQHSPSKLPTGHSVHKLRSLAQTGRLTHRPGPAVPQEEGSSLKCGHCSTITQQQVSLSPWLSPPITGAKPTLSGRLQAAR